MNHCPYRDLLARRPSLVAGFSCVLVSHLVSNCKIEPIRAFLGTCLVVFILGLAKKNSLSTLLIILTGAAIGSCTSARFLAARNIAARLADLERSEIRAYVQDSPQLYKESVTFTVEVRDTTVKGVSGLRIRVYSHKSSVCPEPGDMVILDGKPSLFGSAMNPGEFDLRKYLEFRGIFLRMEAHSLRIVGASPMLVDKWRSLACKARRFIAKRLETGLDQEEASLLKLILIGHEQVSALSESHSVSGLEQVAGSSGLHVDIVSWLVYEGVLKVTRRKGLAVAASGGTAIGWICLFGFAPGALRAAVCRALSAAAWYFRKRYDTLSALGVVAVIACWFMPDPLADPGFVLSCSAAAFGVVASRSGNAVARSVSFYLLMMPAIGLCIGEINPVRTAISSLWLTGVNAAAITALLACCLPGSWFGWVWSLPATALLSLSKATGKFMSVFAVYPSRLETVCLWFAAALSAALVSWKAGQFRPYSFACFLACSNSDGLPRCARMKLHSRILAIASLISVALVLRTCVSYSLMPTAAFLSVGQADCSLVRYRGATVMVDTGTEAAAERQIIPFLKRIGVSRIDCLVISHFHNDHAGGLQKILETIPVGTVLGPSSPSDDLVKCGLGSLRFLVPRVGQMFAIGDLQLGILSTGTWEQKGSENDFCLVVSLKCPGLGVLEFWGDATKEYVDGACKNTRFDWYKDVPILVKVPHHGSADALSRDLYSRQNVVGAVIQVGPNRYGHPSEEVICEIKQAGVRLWRTDCDGAVFFTAILGRVLVRSYVSRDLVLLSSRSGNGGA